MGKQILVIIVAISLLISCGFKGPLYLPKSTASNVEKMHSND
jgi:predicted small lipoprotein YifL